MGFKLISKNNIGGVATLFLIILLSQSRFFDFLIDTTLGRAILILFILGISYTNKILGVVAVQFIIISFSNSNIGYMENFTNNLEEPATISPNKEEKEDSTATTPPHSNSITPLYFGCVKSNCAFSTTSL